MHDKSEGEDGIDTSRVDDETVTEPVAPPPTRSAMKLPISRSRSISQGQLTLFAVSFDFAMYLYFL